MLIKNIDVYHLVCETSDAVTFAHLSIPYRAMLLCKVTTDEGIVGYGEIDAPSTGIPGTIELLTQSFAPRLVGKDVENIGSLWDEMFATLEPMGRLRSHEVYVLGAIDTALWDIMGKAVGRPVSQLLGQYRTRLKAYASLGYANRDKVAQVVEESVERGFQSIKVRIGVVPGEEKGLLGLAREVAGEKIGLMADVNSGWAPHNAVRNARRLECFDLEWIEEPLRTYHLDEVARIAQAIDTPIALGEHQIFTRYDVRMVLERKAADIIQPDMRAGGISEVKRIADIASAWEVPCIPHFYGNGIRFAAMVQLLGSISNYVYIENDIHVNPLRDELVPDCPRAVGGYVDVPSKPGLGVTVDEAVLAKYTVAHQRV